MAIKASKSMGTCDFCGGPATKVDADPAWGVVKCEACRTRETIKDIEDVITRAGGVIVDWQVDNVRTELEHAKELSRGGDRVAAKEALRAASNLAHSLHNAVDVWPEVRTGRKVRQPFEDANRGRSEWSRTEAAAWQRAATKLWAQPLHARKTASDIARLIDPQRWNTIRRKIKR